MPKAGTALAPDGLGTEMLDYSEEECQMKNDDGISSDLLPVLLNMYDAMYAKFSSKPSNATDKKASCISSEGSLNNNKERVSGIKLSSTTTPESTLDCYSHEQIDISLTSQCDLKYSHSPLDDNLQLSRFVYGCSAEQSSGEIDGDSTLWRKARKIQHSKLYSTSSSPTSTVESMSTVSMNQSSMFQMPPNLQSLDYRSAAEGRSIASFRPPSTMSSSSSSSSLSLDPSGHYTSYLASVESLVDSDSLPKKRDSSSKYRRTQIFKAASEDNGVQCSTISLPVPPITKPRYCDPNLSYMEKVILEILETERTYVRDLNDVIQGYKEYWLMNRDLDISDETLDRLFSNIQQIYSFNRRFLGELEQCWSDPVAVAKSFVRNNSGFCVYTEYCTNYPRTVSLLTNLMRNEDSVRACRERQLSLGHPLPLGSYLLKPVQRVLKYHLLLGNILKHFGQHRSGYSCIWEAMSAMTGMAHHINEMKRKHEHAVRVQEIQSLLYGWQGEDLTTYGELAAEGTFRVFGHKGLRHVFLFDKLLLIAKSKDENTLVYKGHIMCSDLMLIESIPGEPLSFHVIPFANPKNQCTLGCRNFDQKREWTLELKRVILETYNASIPEHARQLVMELGQTKSGDMSLNEWRSGGRSKAHNAPEYLERRRDKRRASESGLTSRLRFRRLSRNRSNKEVSDSEDGSRSRSISRCRGSDENEKRTSDSRSSGGEKTRLRLPSWRRSSEPGLVGRLRLSCSPSPDKGKKTRSGEMSSIERNEETPTDAESVSKNEGGSATVDDYSCDETEVAAQENLEHIVSKLLEHQLQLQKIILNKQRRHAAAKKKNYLDRQLHEEQNEEIRYSSLPSTTLGSPLQEEDAFSSLPSEYRTSPLGSSATSRSGSRLSVSRKESFGSDFGQDSFSCSSPCGVTVSSWEQSLDTRSESLYRSCSPRDANADIRHLVRRSKSNFSSSSVVEEAINYDSESNVVTESTCGGEDTQRTSATRKDPIGGAASPNKDIMDSWFSQGQHPSHKIYAKDSPAKRSIRKAIIKLTKNRGFRFSRKSSSDISNSMSELSVDEFDEEEHNRSGALVSSVARQYTKTIRERIKQIRTEEGLLPQRKSNNNTSSLSVGARLATSDSFSTLRFRFPKSGINKKAVDSNPVHTSSLLSPTAHHPVPSDQVDNGTSLTENEVYDPGQLEALDDSFYEKSFEAIEILLENDNLSDSAICNELDGTSEYQSDSVENFMISSSILESPATTLVSPTTAEPSITEELPKLLQCSIGKCSPPVAPKPIINIDPNQDRSGRTIRSHFLNNTDAILNNESSTLNPFIQKGWVKHVVEKLQK